MAFLEHYPYSLKIMFTLLCLSLFCYIGNTILVIYTKSYSIFAIRLFLYFCLSQLFIIVPQLVIPFLTNPDGDPTKVSLIDPYFCQIQGMLTTYGWLSASFLSIYMLFCVLDALKGKKKNSFKWIVSIFVLSSVPNIIFATKNQFILYGWTDLGQNIYQYCSLKISPLNLVFLFGIDFIQVVLLIYLVIQINYHKVLLRKLDINFKHPIMNAHYLSIVHIVLWSFNGGIKALDRTKYYTGKNIEYLWQICNLVTGIEALVVTYIFFYFYLSYMRPSLNRKFYQCLQNIVNCGCFKIHQIQGSVQDESDYATLRDSTSNEFSEEMDSSAVIIPN